MVLLALLVSPNRASCNELAAAVRSPDSISAALGDAYPWVKNLPRDERDLFAEEVAQELAAGASAEALESTGLLVDAWEATAEVYADPELLKRLSGPIEVTHGGPVSRRVL